MTETTTEVVGLTVREFADERGISMSPVRRAVADGFLKVDRKQRPMRIVGGEMPLSVSDWKKRLGPALSALKPGLYGFSDTGRLDVLVDGKVVSLEPSNHWKAVPKVCAEIDKLGMIQRRRMPAELQEA